MGSSAERAAGEARSASDTGDIGVFTAGLVPGDVILIRTNSGIGKIVRALDRSPFNHCAVYTGGGRFVHVLPPATLRGPCVVSQTGTELLETLAPVLLDARRPSEAIAFCLVDGVQHELERGPEFSYNDLLLLAVIADTSDRLADAIAPIGAYLDRQSDWEALLAAHFGVAGPESVTCSELILRSLPEGVRSEVPRTRRFIPDAWQQPIRPGSPLADDVERIIAKMGLGGRRLHRKRTYAPSIAALDEYATTAGRDDLGAAHLNVALSVLRRLAADFNARTPLDLARVASLAADVCQAEVETLTRLTTPGDLERSGAFLRETGGRWRPSAPAEPHPIEPEPREEEPLMVP